jgi:hypothetical protein
MNLEDLITGVVASRNYFLKHLTDIPEEAWAFKPFPECKNLLETLVHLRIDDLMASESIQTLEEPNYEATISAYADMEKGPSYLLSSLQQSHVELLALIRERFASKPLDAEICIWGSMMPLFRGVPYLSSEDFYHAGQAAFIRIAVQPDWDYYAQIYGQPGDQP